MSNKRDHCFVLWADRFDEAAAAIFVTEFRKAGLRTSLVRAAGQNDAGANGLALVPDMSIDEARAVADRSVCVVIPCNTAAVQQLCMDPRVAEFLDVALTDDGKLVVGQQALGAAPWKAPLAAAEVTLYCDQQSMLRLARRIAHQLASNQANLRPKRFRPGLSRPILL